MALLLKEDDVRNLLTMDMAVASVEEVEAHLGLVKVHGAGHVLHGQCNGADVPNGHVSFLSPRFG